MEGRDDGRHCSDDLDAGLVSIRPDDAETWQRRRGVPRYPTLWCACVSLLTARTARLVRQMDQFTATAATQRGMSERAARREGRRAAARLSFSRLRRRLKPEPTIRSHGCSSARGSKLAGGLDSVQAAKAQADKTRQAHQDKATGSHPSPYSYSSISAAPSVPLAGAVPRPCAYVGESPRAVAPASRDGAPARAIGTLAPEQRHCCFGRGSGTGCVPCS
jgi:hypothetical protein